jgi:hypothetical protein
VRLEYEAPDIYPAGVKMERVLTLPGDQNVVIEDTTITPKGVEPGQRTSWRTRCHFSKLISLITGAGSCR